MGVKIKNLAKIGVVNIATANTNLNGTGAMGLVITGGSDGTKVSLVSIKATSSTSEGMVRLFTKRGVMKLLYKEIYIPASSPTSITKSFEAIMSDAFWLDAGDELYASTENAESFNIAAFADDCVNCDCSGEPLDCGSTAMSVANTGVVSISTANGNRNGSGALGTLITAPMSADGGTAISAVVVKATQTTSLGMVRFFISDGIANFLFKEIKVPAMTPTGVNPAYRGSTFLGFSLPPGYSLKVSTENAENFNVVADGVNITYCSC